MNSLIKADQVNELSHEVRTYDSLLKQYEDYEKVGKALHVTFKLESPHHGTIMMLTCNTEGISPAIFNKRYHGDGSMRASAIQSEFMHRGGAIEWDDLGDDGKLASAKFSHPKLMPNPRLITYTIEDARRQVGAKMDKDGSNWKTNPGAMLRAALVRKAVKIIDPGVIGGYDEFNDMDSDVKVIVQEPSGNADAERREARRKELAELESAEVIIDAEVIESSTDESNASEDASSSEESEVQVASNEQLGEIAALGQKIPSEETGQLMTLAEVAANVSAAAGVDSIEKITAEQADAMIVRFKEQLSKL